MKPWEKYAGSSAPAKKPWEKYGASTAPAEKESPSERTWGQAIKEEGGKALQAADDIARIVANGATFGQADRLAAFMNGDAKAEEEKTKAAENRAGLAGTVANIGGAIATPVGLAGQGITLLRPAVTGAKGLTGLGIRAGALGAEGAAYGATDAALNGGDVGNGALAGAAIGGIGGPALEGAGKAIKTVGNVFSKSGKSTPVSLESLREGKNKAYDALENMAGEISPEGTQALASDLRNVVQNEMMIPELTPKSASIIGKINKFAEEGNPISIQQAEKIRQLTNKSVLSSPDPAERMFGHIINDKLDDAYRFSHPEAYAAAQEARAANSRFKGTENFTTVIDKAEKQAAAANSGQNVDNAMRQQVKSLLNSKKASFYTPEQRQAMEEFVQGGDVKNLARKTGNFLNGIGTLASAVGGGLSGGPLGGVGAAAASQALGGAVKKVAAREGVNQAKTIEALLSGGKVGEKLTSKISPQKLRIIEALTNATATGFN